MSAITQFYSLLREAMFENRLTAADISQRKGVHYTYIYNTIRKNANITLETAQQLAEASGYKLQVSFAPQGSSKPLTGKMDSTGPLYTTRKPRTANEGRPADPAQPQEEPAPAADPATSLEDEVNALLDME